MSELVADGPPFAQAPNLVAPVRRGDQRLVRKVHADFDEHRYEAAALRAWSDLPIAVALLEDDGRALLLERLDGISLESAWTPADDDRDTAVLAGVICALRRPPPAGVTLPHIRDWLRVLRTPPPGIPAERAAKMADELLASAEPDVLLHGDLHHGNVLRDPGGRIKVIDPKGVLGDPAYEAGAMLRNPMTQFLDALDPAALTRRRLDICAEMLGTDRERLRAWGFVVQVMSAVWSVADGGDASYALHCAELLK